MKTIRIAPLLAALLSLSASAQTDAPRQRRKVTLREALQLASKQGPDVAAARAQAAITQASVNKAWTAWQPDLSASGTYDHTNGNASIDLSPLGALAHRIDPTVPANAFGTGPVDIVSRNNWYGTFQLSQPLFTPQGLFGPGVASAASEAAQRGADEAREQVLL